MSKCETCDTPHKYISAARKTRSELEKLKETLVKQKADHKEAIKKSDKKIWSKTKENRSLTEKLRRSKQKALLLQEQKAKALDGENSAIKAMKYARIQADRLMAEQSASKKRKDEASIALRRVKDALRGFL